MPHGSTVLLPKVGNITLTWFSYLVLSLCDCWRGCVMWTISSWLFPGNSHRHNGKDWKWCWGQDPLLPMWQLPFVRGVCKVLLSLLACYLLSTNCTEVSVACYMYLTMSMWISCVVALVKAFLLYKKPPNLQINNNTRISAFQNIFPGPVPVPVLNKLNLC